MTITKCQSDLSIQLTKTETQRYFGSYDAISVNDPSARTVLLTLYRHFGGQTQRCYPGQTLCIRVYPTRQNGCTIQFHRLLRLKRQTGTTGYRVFATVDALLDYAEARQVLPAHDELYSDGSRYWLCISPLSRHERVLHSLQQSYLCEHGTLIGENVVKKIQNSRIRQVNGSV